MKNKCKILQKLMNHMGNMKLAKISCCKTKGADFAKFQTWSTKTLLSGPWDKDGRLQIYKKAELSRKQHIELIKYCKKVKISF